MALILTFILLTYQGKKLVYKKQNLVIIQHSNLEQVIAK